MQKTTDNRIIINEEKKYHDNMDDFYEGKDKTEKINGKTENTTETRIIEKKIKETKQERIEENFEQTKEQQKFEEIQHYNNKERLREIGIYDKIFKEVKE